MTIPATSLATDKWTIEPEHTAVIVFAYPDNSIAIEAMGWIGKRFPLDNVVSVNVPNVIAARNSAAKMVKTLPSHFHDIIFIDRDMKPTSASDHFLTLESDIAGCRYDVGSPLPWQYTDAFHLGLCRIRRPVFHALKAPWFEFVMSPDGCDMQTCECVYFAEKAKAAGFSIASAGWADHQPSGSWGH